MRAKVGWRILIVEDDLDYATTVERFLERYPWPVKVVRAAGEACEIVMGEHLAAVIADWFLVDGTAAKVLEALSVAQPATPLLILTGSDDLEPVAAAQAASVEFARKEVVDLAAFLRRVTLQEDTQDVGVLRVIDAFARRHRLTPLRVRIVAKVFEGLGYAKTAESLGISVSAVQTLDRDLAQARAGSLVRHIRPSLNLQVADRREALENTKTRRNGEAVNRRSEQMEKRTTETRVRGEPKKR